MEELLKNLRANVSIKDKDTNEVLFADSNLFVDSGRVFIANVISGVTILAPTYYVCDFGSGSATPTVADTDLSAFITGLSTPLSGSVTILSGYPSGLNFQFIYTNSSGSDITIRELGLFYRDLPSFPLRGAVPSTDFGVMLARLRTTLSSIIIGNTRSITIDWKIIF